MGFWGTVVVHRDERLLWELLPNVAAHRGGDEADPRAALGDRLVLARSGGQQLPHGAGQVVHVPVQDRAARPASA